MRVKITLEGINQSKFVLPINYQHVVQGFLYRTMKPAYAEYLHKYGFKYEKRHFKLFTFSRIFGKYTVNSEKKSITFDSPISLLISSPMEELMQDFMKIILQDNIHLNDNILKVTGVETKNFNNRPNEEIVVNMLSPIVTYSSVNKKTIYYSPFEDKFAQLVKENIIKKFIAYHDKMPINDDFIFKPYMVDKSKDLITTFFTGSNGYNTIIIGLEWALYSKRLNRTN